MRANCWNRWEYNVVESNRDFWRLQSLVPPPIGSAAHALWIKEGKAVAYEVGEKDL